MHLTRLFVLASLLASSHTVNAADLIEVQSINYPVMIEHEGESRPLSLDSKLSKDDVLRTGQRGRVWLRMGDGSVVKLGSNAEFKIERSSYRGIENTTFLDATFNVLKGAFRFTTSFFEPRRKVPHRVNIKVGAITAGLRGTDIWGRSAENEDFVALLDGSIEMEAEGETTYMDKPLTLYRKAANQPADAVVSVPMETVQQLAPETEMSAQDGIASADGRVDLVLMSLHNPDIAADVLKQLSSAGYPVQQEMAVVNGKDYVRIVLSGFDSHAMAANQARRFEQDFSITGAWTKLAR